MEFFLALPKIWPFRGLPEFKATVRVARESQTLFPDLGAWLEMGDPCG
jgi:hypothetical protein